MALHRSDDKLYLFVGESNQVSRLLIAPGATSSGDKTVIVPNLPDSSNIELRGPYRHWLKNLVMVRTINSMLISPPRPMQIL
jgi:hypothetical protein